MMRLQLHNDHSRVSLWVDEYKRTTINKAADHTQHHIQTQHNTYISFFFFFAPLTRTQLASPAPWMPTQMSASWKWSITASIVLTWAKSQQISRIIMEWSGVDNHHSLCWSIYNC